MEATDLIDKYAGKLADTMSTMAPEAWRILVHGAYVDGVVAVVYCASAALGLLLSAIAIAQIPKCRDMTGDDQSASYAAGFTVAILMVCFIFANIDDAITGIAAPERAALRTVMSAGDR